MFKKLFIQSINLLYMSKAELSLKDITIRTDLRRTDLDHVALRHAVIYAEECQFGPGFETYVRESIDEFYAQYDPQKDCAWICEHNEKIVGFISLMHRPENTAQLRYFYLEKAYRGIGLGKKHLDHQSSLVPLQFL